MPVMEGKCALFKVFADVDAFPLCIRSNDVDDTSPKYKALEEGSTTQSKEEISTWIYELQRNSIIGNVEVNEDGSIVTTIKDAYEIMFHAVWGLGSLSRESKEQYNITSALNKWILSPWKDCLDLQGSYTSKDDSYLAYLQKYFKLDSVPFDTKYVCIFRKK